jgi:hypothetical protein
VSEHPLERPLAQLLPLTNKIIGDIHASDNGRQVKVAGMISQLRTLTTKKGDPMAFGTLEDLDDKIDVVFFPRTWKQFRDVVEVDQVMLLWGKVQNKNDNVNIIVDRVQTKVENGAPAEEKRRGLVRNGYGNGNGNGRSAPPSPPPPPNFDEEAEAKPVVDSEQFTVGSEQLAVEEVAPRPVPEAPEPAKQPVVFGRMPNGYAANTVKTIVVAIKPVGNWKEACREVIQMARDYEGEDHLRLEMLSHGWSMDFPNHPTRICQELMVNLRRLPGVATVKAH